MLRDLTIQNYRAFKDFSIDGLARVNLIVGDNNSGKTSFLEAVYLLVNQYNPSALLELLDNRGEFARFLDTPGQVEYQTAYSFHGFQLGVDQRRPEGAIKISSRGKDAQAVSIQVYPRESSLGYSQPGLQLNFSYRSSGDKADQALNVNDSYFFSVQERFSAARRAPSRYHFIGTNGGDIERLAVLWDSITQTPEKEQTVVRAMQLLETEIEDVRLASPQTAGRILIKLAQRRDRFPLSSMGEGLRRVLTLAAMAVVSESGVLFIDEVDTGLYHHALTDVWRLLIETAQRLNVQIFATTHSWDCVEAFQEALANSSDASVGGLFRLEARGENIRKVMYDAEDLAIAVRQAIEVR